MMGSMRRRTYRIALQLLMVAAAVGWAHSSAAQARPEGLVSTSRAIQTSQQRPSDPRRSIT
jgi:hypothetical protein